MADQIRDGNGNPYQWSILSGTNPAGLVAGSLHIAGGTITADEGTPIIANGSAWIAVDAIGSIVAGTVPAGVTYRIKGLVGTTTTFALFALKTNGIERTWARTTPSNLTAEVNEVTVTDLTAGETYLLTATPNCNLDAGSKLVYGNIKIFKI